MIKKVENVSRHSVRPFATQVGWTAGTLASTHDGTLANPSRRWFAPGNSLSSRQTLRRINPNRLRQFARARGALAKNDRIDARLIAEYVATMPTHVVRHDPAAARIAEIVTMRRQLCDEHVAIENQAAQLEDAMLRRLAKRRLARIETNIRLLEKRLTETIAAEADLARRYARLT